MTRTVESMLPEVEPSPDVPDLWQYAIRKRCRQCGAKPLVLCRAPLANSDADDSGLDPQDPRRLHYKRVRAGHRHRLWDLRVGAPEVFRLLSRRSDPLMPGVA